MTDQTSPSPSTSDEGTSVSSSWIDRFHEQALTVFQSGPEKYFDLAQDGKKRVTERHAVELFVDTFGHEVRFVQADRNRWYIASRTRRPGYWSTEDRLGSRQRMRAVLRVLSNVADENLETSGRIKSRLDLAQSDLAMSVTMFNADAHTLGALNGVIDLRTGELRPVSPSMLLTKTTGVAYDDRWVDPKFAVSIDTLDECPRWADHLRVMFRSEETYDSPADPAEIAYVQELVGMTLLGDQDIKEHAFIYLYGGGRNGKGVFVETLRRVLGDYASELDTQLLFRRGSEHTTGFVDLMGVRFATFNEVPRGQIDTATLKRITGGGIIKGRRIAQDNVEWRASHTLWMASNVLPNFGVDTSVGLWSRVILIPTGPPIRAEDRTKDISEALRAEGPAILAWAVEGAVRYLGRGRLPETPVRFKVAADVLEEASDHLTRYLDERYTRDPDAKTLLKQVRSDYEEWLKAEGELGRFDRGPTSTELRGQLEDRGLQVEHGHARKLYVQTLKPSYLRS